jgi:hypothetical protein
MIRAVTSASSAAPVAQTVRCAHLAQSSASGVTSTMQPSSTVKQRNEPRPALPAKPGTLRWYWSGYKQSDHWLGDLRVGHAGLSVWTRDQRTGLIESLLPENGEKPFAVLTRAEVSSSPAGGTPKFVQRTRGWARGFEILPISEPKEISSQFSPV